MIDLPLIDVRVSARGFYSATPLLVLGVFTYLLLHLAELHRLLETFDASEYVRSLRKRERQALLTPGMVTFFRYSGWTQAVAYVLLFHGLAPLALLAIAKQNPPEGSGLAPFCAVVAALLGSLTALNAWRSRRVLHQSRQ